MEKIQYAFFRVAVLFSGLVFCGGALNDVFGAGDGKPIALDKGMSLTVTVSKAKDEAGEKGGLVFSLRFSNGGKETVGDTLIAGRTKEFTSIYLTDKQGRISLPNSVGRGEGSTGGAETPKDCTDFSPAAARDGSGNYVGHIVGFCTEPGGFDVITFGFPHPDDLEGVELILQCAFCPKEGIKITPDMSGIR